MSNPYSKFLLGLDLGQAQDYTALSVVERFLEPESWKAQYHVRHLERFPLGTLYTDVADRVKAICERPELRGPDGIPNVNVLADGTGVGRGVIEMLRERLDEVSWVRAITITGGHQVSGPDGRNWNVPKRDLVGALQVVLQTERLHVAQELPEAKTLVSEMLNFKIKITTNANDTYEAWREGDHDDTVFAIAMPIWWGENHERRTPPSNKPRQRYPLLALAIRKAHGW